MDSTLECILGTQRTAQTTAVHTKDSKIAGMCAACTERTLNNAPMFTDAQHNIETETLAISIVSIRAVISYITHDI